MSGSTLKKYGKGVNTPKPKTSTPMTSRSLPDLTGDGTNISQISCSSSDSGNGCGQKKKEVGSPDVLDYHYTKYLLAFATSKLQQKALSEVTENNENQKMAMIAEVERKRSQLGELKKRIEEVKYLTEQHKKLQQMKDTLASLVGCFQDDSQNMNSLKTALDSGLPVKGFLEETDPSKLIDALCECKEIYDNMWTGSEEMETVFCETAKEMADTQDKLTNIAKIQDRCNETSAVLSHAVLEESVLKVITGEQGERKTQ